VSADESGLLAEAAQELAQRVPMYWCTGERVLQRPGLWRFDGHVLVTASDATFDVHTAREHAEALVSGPDPDRARLGREILEALTGQPSECQTCHGWGQPDIATRQEQARRGPNPPVDDLLRPCGDCNGTGHNLRGTLVK